MNDEIVIRMLLIPSMDVRFKFSCFTVGSFWIFVAADVRLPRSSYWPSTSEADLKKVRSLETEPTTLV